MGRLDLWRVGAVVPNPLVVQADWGRFAMVNRAPWPLGEMDFLVGFILLVGVGVATMAVVVAGIGLILRGLLA